jgi:ribosomal protein L40E
MGTALKHRSTGWHREAFHHMHASLPTFADVVRHQQSVVALPIATPSSVRKRIRLESSAETQDAFHHHPSPCDYPGMAYMNPFLSTAVEPHHFAKLEAHHVRAQPHSSSTMHPPKLRMSSHPIRTPNTVVKLDAPGAPPGIPQGIPQGISPGSMIPEADRHSWESFTCFDARLVSMVDWATGMRMASRLEPKEEKQVASDQRTDSATVSMMYGARTMTVDALLPQTSDVQEHGGDWVCQWCCASNPARNDLCRKCFCAGRQFRLFKPETIANTHDEAWIQVARGDPQAKAMTSPFPSWWAQHDEMCGCDLCNHPTL